MSKITNYLNEHLAGEVVADDNVLTQFATDGSVLALKPHLVVHPRTTDDVRKVARFTWRLAERGQTLPLVARGTGTDVTGAAIANGTILSTPAHMSQIMELDLKQKLVRVQAGMNIWALNQAMATHGLCLPIDGGSTAAMTVGGALATNVAGRRFAKYGCMRDWVEQLEVVLANGEVIQTGRLTRRELNEKKGLQTLEGEIYRAVDSLIDDNPDIVESLANASTLDASGYPLDLVCGDNGSFDLTPLFLGSQGTLGVVTQAILRLVDVPNDSGMIVAAMTGEENLPDLTNRLLELEPAALEFIDGETLKLVSNYTGFTPWAKVTHRLPLALLFIEFDDHKTARKLRKAAKILESDNVTEAAIASSPADVDELMTIYDMVSSVTNHSESGAAALPIATNIAVQPNNVFDTAAEIRQLLRDNHVEAGVWGNVAAGLITVRPVLNLANLGQRQIVFRLLDKLSRIVIRRSGSLTGTNGPGRLLMPWTRLQYDKETAEVFNAVKKIFDPYGILNTGVRSSQADRSDVLAILRQDYRQSRLIEYNLRG